MKWDATQQLIDTSFELTMLAIKYCGKLSVNDKGKEKQMSYKRPKSLDENDVRSAYSLCMNINIDCVVNEIEEKLTGDHNNNILIFKVWYGKIAKRCNLLPLLFSALDWDIKAPETWKTLGGWEQYVTSCKDIREFVWLVATCLQDKFEKLIYEVQSLADTYGIEIDDNYSEETEDSDVSKVKTKPVPRKTKQGSFSDIIQYEDKDKLLNRLHELIDGRSGADVGCVILKAFQENYIIRMPTQKEFASEFSLNGSWSAIHNYMNDNNQNALSRSNRIVFFK